MKVEGLDLAGAGGLAGGLGTLAGAVGGVLAARTATRRHLARCEDRLVDLETTVGILLSLLPGGELAEQFELYRRDRDPEVASALATARRRWRARHGFEK